MASPSLSSAPSVESFTRDARRKKIIKDFDECIAIAQKKHDELVSASRALVESHVQTFKDLCEKNGIDATLARDHFLSIGRGLPPVLPRINSGVYHSLKASWDGFSRAHRATPKKLVCIFTAKMFYDAPDDLLSWRLSDFGDEIVLASLSEIKELFASFCLSIDNYGFPRKNDPTVYALTFDFNK